jgi:hypothetical protein
MSLARRLTRERESFSRSKSPVKQLSVVGAGGAEEGEGEEEGEVGSLTIQQEMRELASAMVADWKEERGGLEATVKQLKKDKERLETQVTAYPANAARIRTPRHLHIMCKHAVYTHALCTCEHAQCKILGH